MKRRKQLKRGGPLRRSGGLRRRTRLRQVSPRRRREREDYRPRVAAYLEAHPVCQLTIALLRLDEREVLATWRKPGGPHLPLATEIHHRNKGRGARLTDERWWASASRSMHDQVEASKRWARAEGFLLPLEADADGRLPDGRTCETTEEWLRRRVLTSEGKPASSGALP